MSNHRLPRLSNGTPITFRRQPFLDGTIRSCFGPTQTPDSLGGTGLPTVGEDGFTAADTDGYDRSVTVEKVYVPPTDWPGKGMLLRPPQVVWLSSCFQLPPLDNPSQWPIATGWGDAVESYMTAASNVEAAFNEAKTRIEAVRPGRTWVSVVDRFYNSTSVPAYWAQYSLVNTVPALPIPDLSGTDPMLMCEFLQIYAGEYCEFTDSAQMTGYSGSTNPSEFSYFNTPVTDNGTTVTVEDLPTPASPYGGLPPTTTCQNGTVDTADIMATVTAALASGIPNGGGGTRPYQVALAAIPDAYKLFPKYGVQIFSIDIPSDPGFPSGCHYESPEENRIFTSPPGTTSFATFDRPPDNAYVLSVGLSGYVMSVSGAVTTFMDQAYVAMDGDPNITSPFLLIGPAVFSDGMFTQMAEDFSDYGVEYSGKVSDITADALVTQIAAFFGFDPGTGLDLG